jgi:16S rRNA G966 N2-methylase RsmD
LSFVALEIASSAHAALAGPFDLVFADPPYAALAEVAAVVAALARALAPGARVAVEHAARDAAPDLAGLVGRASRTYGDTAVTLYDCDEAGRDAVD